MSLLETNFFKFFEKELNCSLYFWELIDIRLLYLIFQRLQTKIWANFLKNYR